MPKKKILFENSKILNFVGKTRATSKVSLALSKIETKQVPTPYSVQILESKTIESGDDSYEEVTVTVSGDANTLQANSIFSFIYGPSKTNDFYAEVPDLVNLMDYEGVSTELPSYSNETIFRYVSQGYDKLSKFESELSLPSVYDNKSKKDFLNIEKTGISPFEFLERDRFKKLIITKKVNNIDYPFYNRFIFDHKGDSKFSNFTMKMGLFEDLLTSFLKDEKQTVEISLQKNKRVSTETLEWFDVKGYLNKTTETESQEFFKNEYTKSAMSYKLKKHLLKGFLKKNSETKFRSLEQILKGETCKVIPFAIHLNKRVSGQPSLQDIYAPFDEERATIVDSQIKYGLTYLYRSNIIYLAVGNSFETIVDSITENDGITTMKARIINKPLMFMFSANVENDLMTVLQPPPVPPQVKFSTEISPDSSLEIRLARTKATQLKPFIMIKEEDAAQEAVMKQNLNGEILFESISDIKGYQVFRTDFPPKNYVEFAENQKENDNGLITTDLIIDKITPNKDYYYTFRSVNLKDFVSNPTEVFKVRLIVDASDAKVNVEKYHFPIKKTSQDSRDFSKLFQIQPAFEQEYFNEYQTALFEKTQAQRTLPFVKLGIAEKSIWGRKFKFRVRSKTTGKVIDFNFRFVLTKNKAEEDF